MIEVNELPASRVIKSLRSDVCPACGGFKKPSHSLCVREYRALPKAMRNALYDRVGEGYELALTNALNHLGAACFTDPQDKGAAI